eukprot:TRINITY_DN29311_c0_g1_i1.p1 TRINITY_DN29311_c0_g1~~TRINITY_DN29311_c0_g1_i1.p1  ORF type:complete len:220 (-),score=18.95 TRINITY_DN29311_c0_g1_i1:68-727(-)
MSALRSHGDVRLVVCVCVCVFIRFRIYGTWSALGHRLHLNSTSDKQHTKKTSCPTSYSLSWSDYYLQFGNDAYFGPVGKYEDAGDRIIVLVPVKDTDSQKYVLAQSLLPDFASVNNKCFDKEFKKVEVSIEGTTFCGECASCALFTITYVDDDHGQAKLTEDSTNRVLDSKPSEGNALGFGRPEDRPALTDNEDDAEVLDIIAAKSEWTFDKETGFHHC